MNFIKKNLWNFNPSWWAKRIHYRITGREARQLFQDLNNAKMDNNEIATILESTRAELTRVNELLQYWQNSRNTRIHPYVSEALSLGASLVKAKNSYRSDFTLGPLTGKFSLYGSDKESRHSYTETYSEILDQIEQPRILEIGLGSLNGYPYGGLPPGGSIKAWRDAYPNALIVGADIDVDAVNAISEIGFVVDQTSDNSLDNFVLNISQYAPFDLIVDDGFHDPHANLRTFMKIFHLLSPNGAYVVEDIHNSLVDFWKVMSSTLEASLEIRDLSADRLETDDNILLIFRKEKD